MSSIDRESQSTFLRHPTAEAGSSEQRLLSPPGGASVDSRATFWKTLAILLALALAGVWALYEWYDDQLDQRIHVDETRLAEQERELSALNSRYLLSRSEQDDSRKEIGRLQEQHVKAREDWAADMEMLRQDKDGLHAHIGELEARQRAALAERQSEIERVAAERDQFAGANELLQKQYAAMTLERDQLQTRLDGIDEAIAKSENEHRERIAELEAHLNERVELSRLTPMDAELAETAKSLGILSADQGQQEAVLVERLEASEQALQETREQLQQAREQLAAKFDEADAASGQDQDRLSQLESDYQAVQQRLVETQDALTSARQQLQDSSLQLAAAEKRADTLATQAGEDADLGARFKDGQERIAVLEDEYQHIQQRLAERESALESAQEKLDAAETELAAARQQIANRETEGGLEEDREQLLADLKQSRERAANAETVLEKLRARQAGFVELGATYSRDGLLLRLSESELRFASGSAELPAGDYPSLERIAKVLQRDDGLSVRIVGHTDNQGAAALNRELSEQRAAAVARALEDQGIDQARLKTAGMGSQTPIADNATAAGRSQNRRVEVYLVE